MKTKSILLLAFALIFVFIGCDEDNDCTVTFHANGGVGAPAAQTASSGSSITLPSGDGMSRSGYTFGGWNTLAAGTGTNYAAGSSYTVNGDVILYAKWIASGITYTVTFNLNYQNPSEPPPDPMAATPGSSVTLPITPVRANYTFDGWNKRADGTGTQYDIGSSYTANDGNITLYAKWAFTVTYNNNGGGTPPSPRKVVPGSSVSLPSSSREGYTFDKWNTSILGTGMEYAAYASFTPTANITLYAQWLGVYTIIFDANCNEGAVNGTVPVPLQATAGESVTIPGSDSFSIAYTTFTGWNTAPGGTGTAVAANSTYAPTGNITLYAKWAFTVTFNNNGEGTPPLPRKVVPGSSVSLPLSSREGYTFDVWTFTANGTGTKYTAYASFTPTANITLYAQWKEDYMITFDANGNEGAVNGTIPVPLKVTAGESVTIPGGDSFSIAYTSFTGWNTVRNGTGTAHAAGSTYTPPGSITFYAQWSAPSSFASVTGNLEEKLKWIQAHAENNGDYNIQVSADETIDPKVLSGSNVKVTLTGSGSNRSVSLSSLGSMFMVNIGVTLTLDNINLKEGIPSNPYALVRVNGGTLIMNSGSGIIGDNTDMRFSAESGVYVDDGGTFTMNDGTISGNSARVSGGGVHVANGATFTMKGGLIEFNTCFVAGGGVYVAGLNINGLVPGNFTKTGGTIRNNVVRSSTLDILSPNHGDAVYVYTGYTPLRRETTAGPSDNLSYVNGVASGGWE